MIQYKAFKCINLINVFTNIGFSALVLLNDHYSYVIRIPLAIFFVAISLFYLNKVKGSYVKIDNRTISDGNNALSIDKIVSYDVSHWYISFKLIDESAVKINISDITRSKRRELIKFFDKFLEK